jgi:hypothetical protein
MREMLKLPPGAAVWGMCDEVERTPPVRRPARREARLFWGAAVVIVAVVAVESLVDD